MQRTEICWKRPSNRPLKEDDREVPLLSLRVAFIRLLACRCLTSLPLQGCHDGTLLKNEITAFLLPFTGLTAASTAREKKGAEMALLEINNCGGAAGYQYYHSPKSNVFYNQPMNKLEDDNDTPILSIFIEHKVLSGKGGCV